MTLFIIFLLQIPIILGNIYKLSFFSPDVRLSALDIAVGLLTLMIILSRPNRFLRLLTLAPKISWALLTFLAWALISLIPVIGTFGQTAVIVGFFYWIRLVLYSLFGFVLVSVFSTTNLRELLLLTGLTLTFVGAVQYLLFPDIRHLQIAEWDPHYYRVVGSLLDPGFIGIMLVLFMTYLVSQPVINRLHQFLILSFVYFIFALTYSRSSYLALLAVAGSFSLTHHSWRPLVLTCLLLLFTVAVLPRSPDGEGVKLERTSSITARIANWGHSLQIIQTHPLTGVGYNVYRYAQKQAGFLTDSQWLKSHSGAGADSSLLFITATTGFIGLLLYINYLRSLFSLRTMNYELSALLVHSLFLNSLFYPLVLFWLACLLAKSISTRREKT